MFFHFRTGRTLIFTTGLLAMASAAVGAPEAHAPLPGTLKPTKGAPQPSSAFLNTVYNYANAMIKSGRDTYGPQKTGLFLSALDRHTLAPLTTRPPAPTGVREQDRPGDPKGPLTGANPMYDETLLRTLRILRGLSGETKYPQAVNEEVRWFLTNASLSGSDLLPWARGMGWDVVADKPVPESVEGSYEWPRPWLMWTQCYQAGGVDPKRAKDEPAACSCFDLVPEQSKKFAAALLKYRQSAGKDRTDVRQIGFDLRTWAAAYGHTKDKQFLDAVEATLAQLESPATQTSMRVPNYWRLSAAVDCYAASLEVPEPLGSRLRAFANKEDQAFCGLAHDLIGKGGFFRPAQTIAGSNTETFVSPLWDPKAAHATTAAIGMMCVARYQNGGNVCLKKLIIEAAQAYLKSNPPEHQDLWPLTVGQVISLEMAAWRATADRVYFDKARELGTWAVKAFWGDSPLPRASLKSDHYENLTGADTLATALLELHLSILHITAVPPPANTADR